MKFEELYKIDVRDKVEQKNGLNYLSWAYAWAEIKKNFDDAHYEIEKFENNLPYVYDEKTGYMVFTRMEINGIEHEMWLPVMDGANMPMLDHDYTYQVKEYVNGKWTGGYVEKECKKANMFDINKTIMRCLTKNIAMFGLGLSLYQGEDLPSVATKEEAEKVMVNFGKYQGKRLQEIYQLDKKYFQWLQVNSKDENIRIACDLIDPMPSDEEQEQIINLLSQIQNLSIEKNIDIEEIKGKFKVDSLTDLSIEQMKKCIAAMKKKEV